MSSWEGSFVRSLGMFLSRQDWIQIMVERAWNWVPGLLWVHSQGWGLHTLLWRHRWAHLLPGPWTGSSEPWPWLGGTEARLEGCFRICSWTEVGRLTSRGTGQHASWWVCESLTKGGLLVNHSWERLKLSHRSILGVAIRLKLAALPQRSLTGMFPRILWASRTVYEWGLEHNIG